MCGRLNIIDDPLCQLISEMVGIDYSTKSNDDLCPSQDIAAIIKPPNGFMQINASWGIQPSWSKKLLINAQAESAHQKPTFKESFHVRRCLIPISGWYEWRTENGKKEKYLFSQQDERPLLMAGVWYQNRELELVSLTTKPSDVCAEYHHRMPMLIQPDKMATWFDSNPENLHRELGDMNKFNIKIDKCA